MVNQRIVCSIILSVLLAGGLSACNKKKDEAAAQAEAAASNDAAAPASAENGVKSENDLYIERLNKDVKVENPDALLDEVNKDAQHK